MITVKSIKKEPIGDLVTRDDELEAYMSSQEFQKAKAVITDHALRKEAGDYDATTTKPRANNYNFYTKMMRKQAVKCVKSALLDPVSPVLKKGVMTLRIYALDCGLVTSDPFSITRCVESYKMPRENSRDKTYSELGVRLLYALNQSGQRISVSFTFPDELGPNDCGWLDGCDGFNELVSAVVDAVLEWESGHARNIWC